MRDELDIAGSSSVQLLLAAGHMNRLQHPSSARGDQHGSSQSDDKMVTLFSYDMSLRL
jgi:hypothetical protein